MALSGITRARGSRAGVTGADRLRAWLAIALLAASGWGTAHAASAQVEEGIKAYDRQEYDTAVKLIRPLAEAGEVEAQYFMGTFYMWGTGVPLDPTTAGTWYHRAYDQWLGRANRGDVPAMVETARILTTGIGVERDDTQALAWLRKAAEQNYPDAWAELGNMYLAGDGVPQDRAEATRWYQKAAAVGNKPATEALDFLRKNSDQDIQDMLEKMNIYK